MMCRPKILPLCYSEDAKRDRRASGASELCWVELTLSPSIGDHTQNPARLEFGDGCV